MLLTIFLFLFMLILLFYPATHALFFLSYLKVNFGYPFLFEQSLPGLLLEREKHSLWETVALSFDLPLPRYPYLLFNTEFAGFKVLKASRLYHESDYPLEDNDLSEPELLLAVPRTAVLSLQEDKTGLYLEGSSKEESPMGVNFSSEKPLVLVYHTHTTESFLPESGEAFTDNLEQTVVVLGAYLAEVLGRDFRIPVLHVREIFDIPRRYGYEKAGPRIQQILEENPQIQVVLDVHRDGVPRKITTTSMKGQETGRILFVVGSRHQTWPDNLRYALFLHEILEERYHGLSRGIRQQSYSYNQHLHSRSIIVEIGGHENSLEEVKRAIPFLAEAIAETFTR